MKTTVAVRLWTSASVSIALLFSAEPVKAQGVVIGAPAANSDGVCAATETLAPPDKRPWVATARQYYGAGYAQAVDDYATGLATYDEQALERAIAVFRASSAIGAKANAAAALHLLAKIRRDTGLLDQAIDLAAAEYEQYGSREKDKYYRSAVTSARLQEISILMTKATASHDAEALALAVKAETLARAAAAMFPEKPNDPYGPPPFDVAAALALALQGTLREDWPTISRAIGELQSMMARLSKDERVELGTQLATMIIYSAEHAPKDQRSAILRQGGSLADTLLVEAAAQESSARATETASRLNETGAGQWKAPANGDRSRCLQRATLRALAAMADLEDASDDASREGARRRLEVADHQFSAVPPFEHAPTFQYALARSFAEQLEQAPSADEASLRERGRRALREAKRLREACFCNQLDRGLAELDSVFAVDPATVTVP